MLKAWFNTVATENFDVLVLFRPILCLLFLLTDLYDTFFSYLSLVIIDNHWAVSTDNQWAVFALLATRHESIFSPQKNKANYFLAERHQTATNRSNF